MRRIIAALITLTVLPALMLAATPAPEANAFCTKLGPTCRDDGHDAITRDALRFLSPSLVDRVVQKNVAQDAGDTSGRPELHFSNCLFEESTAYIQSQYQKIIAAIAPTTTATPDTASATTWWGQLLHTVQDFYSHSSWVDPEPVGLGFGTTHAKHLLDAGLVNWRSIRPYASLFPGSGPFSDIVALEGNRNPPEGLIALQHDQFGHPTLVPTYTPLSPDAVDTGTGDTVRTGTAWHAPSIFIPMGTRLPDDALHAGTAWLDPSNFFKTYRGLMTAVSEPLNTVEQKCPPANGTNCLDEASTCIRHGGMGFVVHGECATTFPRLRPIWDNCFNHDRSVRPNHDDAFDMAVAQTRHEWCRLLHMLRDQKGYDAASVPIALWVRSNATMHPPGTQCGERAPERASVTVEYKGVWSRSVGVSTFVAYTDDFRQSFRDTGERARSMRGSGQICIEPDASKTIAATMWGYDKSAFFGQIVRIGTTVELHGPNYPTGVQTASSQDVRLEVSVKRDTHPAAKCGRTGVGGSGGGGGGPGGGGPGEPGGGHKTN